MFFAASEKDFIVGARRTKKVKYAASGLRVKATIVSGPEEYIYLSLKLRHLPFLDCDLSQTSR
jgi:hypothetical protein